VRVRDNGSGMEPSLVPKVFDLFTQGDRTPDRSQGGLGLGLTLVKLLFVFHPPPYRDRIRIVYTLPASTLPLAQCRSICTS
jgi:signal transduction histidine kinase